MPKRITAHTQKKKSLFAFGIVPNDVHAGRIILVLIHSHDKHRGISRGGGDYDLPGPTLQVSTGLVSCGEDTSGLNNKFSTS